VIDRPEQLAARERQVMDAVYKLGAATVSEVLAAIPSPPSYSTVRTHLRILEQKGMLRHREDGRRYVYTPTVPHRRAQRSALERVLNTFFSDSPSQAVAALLDMKAGDLTNEALDELADLIEQARREGR
jgi:BlaI family transcriptional regulator, penicillinase repressor